MYIETVILYSKKYINHVFTGFCMYACALYTYLTAAKKSSSSEPKAVDLYSKFTRIAMLLLFLTILSNLGMAYNYIS